MNNKITFGIIGVTLVILVAGVAIAQKTNPSAEIRENQNTRAQVEQTTHDWGTIPLNGGDVTQTFTIANAGTEPLQLYDVKTSCMCTTAQVMIKDQTSPSFGMHQKSNWVGEVLAGGTADVEVTFAPDYHGPSGVGAITRQVDLKTNDPENPNIVFNLTAEVVND